MSIKHFDYSINKNLYICSLHDNLPKKIEGSFAVLFPAFDKQECENALLAVPHLLSKGCLEFCCVGSFAEHLHDEIDYLVENLKRLDITTTYDLNMRDACEYFIYAVGVQVTSNLVAFTFEHGEICDVLENEIKSLTSITRTK